MPQRVRIFVSSPGDVPDERLRADLIIEKLAQDYTRFFIIESYRWETEPMLASGHFQDAIEPPSAFDIVVLILWSRLGTPLPERTALREYRGIDGRAPVTGTEWEYEEALKVAREKGAPDLLAFRNVSPALIDTRDPAVRATINAQLDALDQFWRRHFADKGVFLAAYDEYSTLEDFAHRLEESLRKLIERRIKSVVTETTAPLWLGEPFRGLESYEFEHAPIFFGRDAAIAKATRQLAANARAGHAFLLVCGPSGSGKSSLVKAGIVPRLMKPQRISGAAFVRRVLFRPASEESDLFLGLTHALLHAGDDDSIGLKELIAPGQNAEQLETFLRNAAEAPGFLFGNALGHLTEVGRQSGRLLAFEDAKLILVIDQLEELFTRPGIGLEDRNLFIRLLDRLARSGTVWVIMTLRDDFWHRAVEISELRTLSENEGRIDLAAPSPAELTEIIRKPAQAAGLSFDAQAESGLSLDAVLAEDASAAPGALPLLSFTLDELYKDAKGRGEAVLRHRSYEALGGLQGAIAKRADEILGSMPAAMQTSLPRVLRALTTVIATAGQAPVAQPATLASFGEGTPARALVDAFVAARLLVAASEADAPATVRLAHEALITRWQRACDIIAENADFYRVRADIEEQRRRYEEGRRRSELLLRGRPLAEAEDIVKKYRDELSSQTLEYVKVSRAHANRSKIISWSLAAIFAVLAIGMWRLAEFAFGQMTVAQGQEKLVRSQSWLMQGNVAQAIQDGLAAYDLLPSEPTRANLLAALGRLSPYSLGALDSPADTPGPVAWAADNTLSIAMRSGELRSLAVAGSSGAPTQPRWMALMPADIRRTGAVAVALRRLSDGDLIIAYSDGAIGILREHAVKAAIYAASNSDAIYPFAHATAISRNGSLVAMASIGSVIVSFRCDWRSATSNPCQTFHLPLPQSGDYRAVAISPDEQFVAVGDQAGNLFVCGPTSCRATAAPLGGAIAALAWSSDGKALAAGTMSAEVIVVDPASFAQLGHASSQKPVNALAWKSSGSELASSCDRNVICLWDMPNGSQAKAGLRLVGRLVGHSGAVLRVSWSPNGSVLASISDDGEVHTWSATQNTGVMYELPHCDAAEFDTLAVSSDLSQIAAAGADGLTCVWSVSDGRLITTLADLRHLPVESLAWSKDGSLAILHQSGTLESWSNDFRQNRSYPSLTIEPLARVIWSSDDKLLVVTASQGRVAIFDSTDPSKPPKLAKYLSAADGAAGLAVRQSDDLLFVSYPHTIGMVNLHSNSLLGEIPAAPSFSGSLSLSPDARLLAATGSDSFVDIYDIANKAIWRKLPVDEKETRTVSISPDGRRLAVLGSGKGVIYIFDVSAANPTLLEALDLSASAILSTGQPNPQRVNWIGWLAPDKLAAVSSDGKVVAVNLDEESWESRIHEVGLAPVN